jgi:phosphoglycerate dehydrogenase-like enzyme
LGQILLSCKGFFLNTTQYHRNNGDKNAPKPFTGAGVYGESIALLGMGAVARELVGLLQGLDLKILVVDPYLTDQEAAELGVERVTMAEGFARGYVISNHLPNLPELHGVIDEPLLASMRSHATFINTGRGAEVNEAALLNVARHRRDLTFLLDVTAPEPPVPGSPLFQEENIWITSHIAGALNDEVRRMGDFVVTEFEKYARGEPLRFADTLEMLNRLA